MYIDGYIDISIFFLPDIGRYLAPILHGIMALGQSAIAWSICLLLADTWSHYGLLMANRSGPSKYRHSMRYVGPMRASGTILLSEKNKALVRL